MVNDVPKHILNFGLIGALPYLGTSLSTLYLARQASQAATGLISTPSVDNAIALLESCSYVQVTYGAVMLSFLGALHWGMEFSRFGGYQGYPRLALGAAPLLAAWPTLAMEPQMALVVQWFGFTLLVRIVYNVLCRMTAPLLIIIPPRKRYHGFGCCFSGTQT